MGGKKRSARALLSSGSVPSQSPFEYMHARQKHSVLGRRVKGTSVNVAQARARGMENRQRTLAPELEREGRTSVFRDERFGEQDGGMELDDKMLGRYMLAKRAKTSGRKSRFTLGDDDGDADADAALTHLGQRLGDDNMREWDAPDDDEEEDRERSLGSAAYVRALNFGGGDSAAGADDGAQQPPKSRQEVMDEIIAKSKFHRAERAKAKLEQTDTIARLDADFGDIRALLSAHMAPTAREQREQATARATAAAAERAAEAAAAGGEEAVSKATVRTLPPKQRPQAASQPPARAAADDDAAARSAAPPAGPAPEPSRAPRAPADKYDDFEQLSRELGLQSRARPAERLRSEAEKLEAEAERLSRLEAERRARMRGEGGADGAALGAVGSAGRALTDDDLEVNYVLEGEGEGEEADDDGDDEDDDDDDDDDDEEEEDEDELDEDEPRPLLRSAEEAADAPPTRAAAAAAAETAEARAAAEGAGADELPYTPRAPSTAAELDALLALARGSAPREQLLLNRVLATHHVKLSVDNRPRMAALFSLLLGRFSALAGAPPVPLRSLDAMCAPLFTLCQMMPMVASERAKAVVGELGAAVQRRARREARRDAAARAGPAGCTALTPAELLLVKLLALLYPVSDRRHPVCTPCTLLLGAGCAALGRARARTLETPLLALAHAALLLHYCAAEGAERVAPELAPCVVRAARGLARAARARARLAPHAGHAPARRRALSEHLADGLRDARAASVEAASADEGGALGVLLDGAEAFAALATELRGAYAESAAAPELLGGLATAAAALAASLAQLGGGAAARAATRVGGAADALSSALASAAAARRPLALHRRAPVPLRLLEPQFDEKLDLDHPARGLGPEEAAELKAGARHDPDAERELRARARLRREHKAEQKAAARELRKDAAFVAGRRREQKAKLDAELDASQRRARAILEDQESGFKTMLQDRKKALKAKL